MKDFNFNKYIRHGFLLKENVDSENMTIELDMAWDDDAAAQEAFDKYHINVQGTGAAGTYEVSGKKEDILAYLRSDYYDMPMEDIAEFYPELLGNAEYTSDTDFDIYDQGDESDPIGGPLGEDDSEWQEGDEDMFNDWENIPPDVMAILDKYSEEEQSYQILQRLQDELEAIGYTFDWGLDAEPYGLRKIDTGSIEEDDSSLFGPDIEKSRSGNLSDYYRNAEPTVTHVANKLDDLLGELVQDKSRLEELTDLIVALSDAYAGQDQ